MNKNVSFLCRPKFVKTVDFLGKQGNRFCKHNTKNFVRNNPTGLQRKVLEACA